MLRAMQIVSVYGNVFYIGRMIESTNTPIGRNQP